MWLGILARVGGEPERALEHLARARASAIRNGARMSLLRITLLEAEALIDLSRAPQEGTTDELLARAAAECEQLGYVSVLEHATRLRERLAGTPPHAAPATAAPAPDEPAPGPGRAGGGSSNDVPRATLRRAGDVWTIDDGRRTLHLNDGRGVRLLAVLLERPGEEVHCLKLVAIVDGTEPAGGSARAAGLQDDTVVGGQSGTGPPLDAAAKAAYRARIAQLTAEVAAAQAHDDEARARRARKELEFITGELARATGIGGRDRGGAGSHAERARINVTRAIRSTVKRIEGYHPQLGRELQSCIRTGTYCVYEPEPRRPLRWIVDHGR